MKIGGKIKEFGFGNYEKQSIREIGILLSVATALLGRLRHKDFNSTSSIFIWFHFASMQKPWQNTLCIPAKGTYAAFNCRRQKSEYPARPVLDAKIWCFLTYLRRHRITAMSLVGPWESHTK